MSFVQEGMVQYASNELHFPLGTEFFIFDTYIVHQAKRKCEVFRNFTKMSPSYAQVVLPLSEVYQAGCFESVSPLVHSASVRVFFSLSVIKMLFLTIVVPEVLVMVRGNLWFVITGVYCVFRQGATIQCSCMALPFQSYASQ